MRKFRLFLLTQIFDKRNAILHHKILTSIRLVCYYPAAIPLTRNIALGLMGRKMIWISGGWGRLRIMVSEYITPDWASF